MSRKKKKIKTTKTVRQVRRKNLLSRRQSIIGLGIFLFACFFVLSPLLSSSFLNYDDDIYITGNPYILNPNIHSIKALFGEYFANQYAPVSMLIMALEIQLVGVDAWGLKLFSILFHLLNTFLVFRLIDLWFDRKDWDLIVAAVFCFHPI